NDVANIDLMRQKLAMDLKNPNDTSQIDFVLSDIIQDPIVRYEELKSSLMVSLDSNSVEDLLIKINLGARLHNIGKICIPLSLIDGGKVGKSQKAQIATHIKEGERILTAFGFPDEVKDMALYHHAKKNYYKEILESIERAQNNTEIPIQAKLIEILDIYNAMTTPRSYRPEVKSRLEALHIIKNDIGSDNTSRELYNLFIQYLLNN
ncbi:MAG: HD domain-containing protein, partial [Candidatus Falkowbacteria bacterium]|nr:HD domain-containing protein [Candidatus Falkowbacteria bacterium]